MKNRLIETDKQVSSLVENIIGQHTKRTKHLPDNTQQHYFLDVRGQHYGEERLHHVTDMIRGKVDAEMGLVFIRNGGEFK